MIEQLISAAREGVDARRREVPLADLEAQLHGRGEDRPFNEALTRPGLSLIGEFKRRSPSAGALAPESIDRASSRSARRSPSLSAATISSTASAPFTAAS